MNLWLAPADPYNLNQTIHRKVHLQNVKDKISNYDFSKLSNLPEAKNGFHCWATTQKIRCDQMEEGDIAMLVSEGIFEIASKIIYKLQSQELGESVDWKQPKGKIWEYTYILGSVIIINISSGEGESPLIWYA